MKHNMRQHRATLVYKEEYDSKEDAAKREKQIKDWKKEKKLELIKINRNVNESSQ
jgi:predicted GIY-YIG superfamily endonuclease